jgi:hypothetical protein
MPTPGQRATIPVRYKSKAKEGSGSDVVHINEEDFDEEKHTRVDETKSKRGRKVPDDPFADSRDLSGRINTGSKVESVTGDNTKHPGKVILGDGRTLLEKLVNDEINADVEAAVNHATATQNSAGIDPERGNAAPHSSGLPEKK